MGSSPALTALVKSPKKSASSQQVSVRSRLCTSLTNEKDSSARALELIEPVCLASYVLFVSKISPNGSELIEGLSPGPLYFTFSVLYF